MSNFLEDKLLMASTWFFIKAINGDNCCAFLNQSWKLITDLPPPVGTTVLCCLVNFE
jgi:hypothetical protein